MTHLSHLLGFFHICGGESSLHIFSWDDGQVVTPSIFATCSCTRCALLSAMEGRSDWPEEAVHELNLWVKWWVDKYIQGKVCWQTGFWWIPEQFTLSGWDDYYFPPQFVPSLSSHRFSSQHSQWHPILKNAFFFCQEQTYKTEVFLLLVSTLWKLDFLASGKSQLLLARGDGDMHFAPMLARSAHTSLNKDSQGNSESFMSILHSSLEYLRFIELKSF